MRIVLTTYFNSWNDCCSFLTGISRTAVRSRYGSWEPVPRPAHAVPPWATAVRSFPVLPNTPNAPPATQYGPVSCRTRKPQPVLQGTKIITIIDHTQSVFEKSPPTIKQDTSNQFRYFLKVIVIFFRLKAIRKLSLANRNTLQAASSVMFPKEQVPFVRISDKQAAVFRETHWHSILTNKAMNFKKATSREKIFW